MASRDGYRKGPQSEDGGRDCWTRSGCALVKTGNLPVRSAGGFGGSEKNNTRDASRLRLTPFSSRKAADGSHGPNCGEVDSRDEGLVRDFWRRKVRGHRGIGATLAQLDATLCGPTLEAQLTPLLHVPHHTTITTTTTTTTTIV
jgi:hypothetical protein